MAKNLGFKQLLPLLLCWAPGLAQRDCEPCVTVTGDSSDPLVGIYRYLEEEASCEEYGCSCTKDGSPDEVYCFKDGSYQAEAGNECPSEATGPTPASLSSENQQITSETTPVNSLSTLSTSSDTPSLLSTPTPSTSLSAASTGSTGSTEAVTASVLSSPESVEESISTVRSQSADLTTDLIDQVRDIDADTATKLEELKAKLDDLSETLEAYKLEISSRRRQADDSCSSLSQQLEKLATLRTETEELILLADTILELTILPDDVRALIETFKDYHENHLEEINAEETAKNADYSASCESTT